MSTDTKVIRSKEDTISRHVDEILLYIRSPRCTSEKRKALEEKILEEFSRVKKERETCCRKRNGHVVLGPEKEEE